MSRHVYAAVLLALALVGHAAAGWTADSRRPPPADPAVEADIRSRLVAGGSDEAFAATLAHSRAVALERAIARGLHRRDAVVVRRLIELAVFVGEASPTEPARALERAVELGLHRSDLVVRRRLIEAAAPERPAATASAAAPPSFLSPPLTHVFVAAGQDPGTARERAEELLDRLNAARGGWPAGAPEQAGVWPGDPFPAGRQLPAMSEARLAATLGAQVAASAASLVPGLWYGPYRSRWGWHLVRVEDASAPASGLRASRLRAKDGAGAG